MTSEELHAYEQALDDVENPCTHPVGAPGSAKRRANDLGLKLASMTKRAEEAEKTCEDYMTDIEALGRKVDAAESKLAMAEAAAQRDAELIDIGGRLATIVFNTSQPAYDLADYDRKVMREWSDKWDAKSRERRLALRDLGVEPDAP